MSKSYKDRFFLVRLTRDEREVRFTFVVIGLLLLVLLINTGYLTILSIKKSKSSPVATAMSHASPSAVVTLPPTIVPTSITSQTNSSAAVTAPSVKEYFIPLGAGSSAAGDWTDVPGLSASVDFGSYSHIKEIHFEASVGIPTANESASVRLFNESDKHPVWYSEITLENGQFISSNPIIYDAGQKLYQVQMKTSLQYTANLIQSRIHIILQ